MCPDPTKAHSLCGAARHGLRPLGLALAALTEAVDLEQAWAAPSLLGAVHVGRPEAVEAVMAVRGLHVGVHVTPASPSHIV